MTIEDVIVARWPLTKYEKAFKDICALDSRVLAEELKQMDYAEFLETAYWHIVSTVRKLRVGGRCQLCYHADRLQAHHRTYKNHGAEHMNLDDLTVLCDPCHEKHHFPDRPIAPRKAQMPSSDVAYIRKPKVYTEKVAIEAALKSEPGWIRDGDGFMRNAFTPNGGRSIIITHAILRQFQTARGGFTAATARALGVGWPLQSGWTKRLIGKIYSEEDFQRAMGGKKKTGRAN